MAPSAGNGAALGCCCARRTAHKLHQHHIAMHPLESSMDLQSLILVVDDDPDLRKLIGDFLSAHGYRVATAENVAEMRRSIEEERPDLVVLDAMMPGEDGLSAARRLAAQRGPAGISCDVLGKENSPPLRHEEGGDGLL